MAVSFLLVSCLALHPDQSGWAFDDEALNRPLFPAVDHETGLFRLGTHETFEVLELTV